MAGAVADGPTRGVLMERAAALAGYRVGAPLGFEQLRFIRSSSAASVALGWLARGSPAAGADLTGGRLDGGGLVRGHRLPGISVR